MYKKESGITLAILVITVIVLIVITGVIVYAGLGGVKNAKIESLKTNMLLIQAKGKEYVENASFHYGTGELTDEQKQEIKNQYLKGTRVSGGLPTDLKNNEEAYALSSNDMLEMGLNDLADTAEDYIIIYNIEGENVDVMYKPGIANNNTKLYTLSSIEEAGI